MPAAYSNGQIGHWGIQLPICRSHGVCCGPILVSTCRTIIRTPMDLDVLVYMLDHRVYASNESDGLRWSRNDCSCFVLRGRLSYLCEG